MATTVRGTWTATGGTLRVVSTYHARGFGTTQNSTFQGSQRQATASASIGGIPVAGSFAGADINDAKSNSVWICHGLTC